MRLVLCNCSSDAAEKIGREIIEKGLAASVNALPRVQRIYRQDDDQLCVKEETMLLIQTLKDRVEDLIQALVEIHPSAMPEIISLSIFEGSKEYITWVEDTLKKSD